jgi:hypothetical protein
MTIRYRKNDDTKRGRVTGEKSPALLLRPSTCWRFPPGCHRCNLKTAPARGNCLNTSRATFGCRSACGGDGGAPHLHAPTARSYNSRNAGRSPLVPCLFSCSSSGLAFPCCTIGSPFEFSFPLGEEAGDGLPILLVVRSYRATRTHQVRLPTISPPYLPAGL